ncbi:MAG: hypothetical protein ABSH41_32445 [Syntrophobacteraceae bacterium]
MEQEIYSTQFAYNFIHRKERERGRAEAKKTHLVIDRPERGLVIGLVRERKRKFADKTLHKEQEFNPQMAQRCPLFICVGRQQILLLKVLCASVKMLAGAGDSSYKRAVFTSSLLVLACAGLANIVLPDLPVTF